MGYLYGRFLTVILLIAAVLAIGTVGFVWISGYPVFDAFYMSLITITTVGYFEVHTLDRAGRIFNSFLVLFGVSTMFYAVGVITQTVLETEFTELFQKRRSKRMIDQLNDHYIVCGFGRVGRGAAAELQRTGVPFLVMDRNKERVEWAIKSGITAVLADATRDELLIEAGVHRARGLIAALASDSDNLFLILSAKGLNPKLKVSARVGEEASEAKMRRAGADAVFMPYTITGYRLAQSMLRPHVFEFLDMTGSTSSLGANVGIEEVQVGTRASLASKSLRDLQLRRNAGVIVLAIRRADGQMIFNPPAEAVIETGDTLIVMGAYDDVSKLQNLVNGA
jgi:voltage-gated potassium channel